MRAFIALTLSSEDKVWLSQWPDKLKEQDRFGDINWVATANFHLTLAFLGDISEQFIEPLGHSLASALASSKTVDLEIEEVGGAQFTQNKKFVVASVIATEPLLRLQKKVHYAARQAGILLPKRAFKPHITLGRLRSRHVSADVSMQPMPHRYCMQSDCVRVYQSELAVTGACYTPLVDIDLAKSVAAKISS